MWLFLSMAGSPSPPEQSARSRRRKVWTLMIDRGELERLLVGAQPQELVTLGSEITGRGFVALVAQKGAPQEEDRLLDMVEVAKALGVVAGQARDMGRRGELPIVMVGRYVRVRASSLREWMDTREAGRLRPRRLG